LIEWSKARGWQPHIQICLCDERRKTDVIDADEMVIAVLAILPADRVALQQYCELIEIDGTYQICLRDVRTSQS
jgi:hypothetical protein